MVLALLYFKYNTILFSRNEEFWDQQGNSTGKHLYRKTEFKH